MALDLIPEPPNQLLPPLPEKRLRARSGIIPVIPPRNPIQKLMRRQKPLVPKPRMLFRATLP